MSTARPLASITPVMMGSDSGSEVAVGTGSAVAVLAGVGIGASGAVARGATTGSELVHALINSTRSNNNLKVHRLR